MKSKVKSAKGRRTKGASGEREAACLIMQNCPGLHAERNARNGKVDTDVLVWRRDGNTQYRFEVKRVESLDLGTKAMEKIRFKATEDDASGILWRRNGEKWRLDVVTQILGGHFRWVTVSGDDVWRVIEEIVQ